MTVVVPLLVVFRARDVKVEPNHRAEARATESHRSRELEHPISKIFYPTNTTTYQLHRDGSWFNRFHTTDVTPTPRKHTKGSVHQLRKTAMATQTLHGACACGRNRYVVEMPSHEVQQAEMQYDNTSASRKLLKDCREAVWPLPWSHVMLRA
jgi:hypothetical protein